MEMKKISLAIIVVAAFVSVVLAADLPKDPLAAAAAARGVGAATPKASAAPVGSAASPTPSSATGTPTSAHAPSPSGAASAMPVVGSLAGAFLMSFFGYYLQ
ncbi:unnamed protein product [Prunus armeniaca]|uniref:Uncharacterized protein n=1 Tax=Prunus armeniaca TaxID=36596 RepID=A0A6J5XY05_PRUAR|nr:hypothetical protein GBA52_024162 [Prunus armeniaca]CAB4286767.1 unnamed protein product [Prunus armeniaca]CAB4317137.1 unnamed protein product [Prunus armeniaca]